MPSLRPPSHTTSAAAPAGLLPAAQCYPALQARDARFDGQWFVAVTSTGIYCRPVCRVRTPMAKNCWFFGSAAQAEAAHFRPCLKCRPELAPKPAKAWTTMDASNTLARQAAAWLDACDDPAASVEQLAQVMGISSRHLRRIFVAAHGVSPLQYLQTRRLLLAKQLLTDSRLPVPAVAAAAGFASVRRFHAVFAERYRLQPTALRQAGGTPSATLGTLKLTYRQPYDVEGLLRFLAPRAVAGVECVDMASATVTRSLSLRHAGQLYRGWLRVDFGAPGRVELQLSDGLWPTVATLMPCIRRWLDLDADPAVIAAALGANAAPGLRLPGCLDRFELAVRAVLGQQVTVAAARTLAGRFVSRFGTPLEGAPAGVERTFPTPDLISHVRAEHIAELGIIRRRADSIVALAQRWPDLAYARQEGSFDEALQELQGIAGIGPWTAHYMLMRGWSWPDAFPPGDVVLRRQLSAGMNELISPKAYQTAAAAYAPYRSYAVLHLWRQATT